jgi:hypothetical protein
MSTSGTTSCTMFVARRLAAGVKPTVVTSMPMFTPTSWIMLRNASTSLTSTFFEKHLQSSAMVTSAIPDTLASISMSICRGTSPAGDFGVGCDLDWANDPLTDQICDLLLVALPSWILHRPCGALCFRTRSRRRARPLRARAWYRSLELSPRHLLRLRPGPVERLPEHRRWWRAGLPDRRPARSISRAQVTRAASRARQACRAPAQRLRALAQRSL